MLGDTAVNRDCSTPRARKRAAPIPPHGRGIRMGRRVAPGPVGLSLGGRLPGGMLFDCTTPVAVPVVAYGGPDTDSPPARVAIAVQTN